MRGAGELARGRFMGGVRAGDLREDLAGVEVGELVAVHRKVHAARLGGDGDAARIAVEARHLCTSTQSTAGK